jgi:hypothetical protein
MSQDLSNLETPPKCTADFCLIPLGTPTASVSAQIADVQRLMKASGLKYSMHSAGTTVGKFAPLSVASRPWALLLGREESVAYKKPFLILHLREAVFLSQP